MVSILMLFTRFIFVNNYKNTEELLLAGYKNGKYKK